MLGHEHNVPSNQMLTRDIHIPPGQRAAVHAIAAICDADKHPQAQPQPLYQSEK